MNAIVVLKHPLPGLFSKVIRDVCSAFTDATVLLPVVKGLDSMNWTNWLHFSDGCMTLDVKPLLLNTTAVTYIL